MDVDPDSSTGSLQVLPLPPNVIEEITLSSDDEDDSPTPPLRTRHSSTNRQTDSACTSPLREPKKEPDPKQKVSAKDSTPGTSTSQSNGVSTTSNGASGAEQLSNSEETSIPSATTLPKDFYEWYERIKRLEEFEKEAKALLEQKDKMLTEALENNLSLQQELVEEKEKRSQLETENSQLSQKLLEVTKEVRKLRNVSKISITELDPEEGISSITRNNNAATAESLSRVKNKVDDLEQLFMTRLNLIDKENEEIKVAVSETNGIICEMQRYVDNSQWKASPSSARGTPHHSSNGVNGRGKGHK